MVLFAIPVCPGSIPHISHCLYMQKTPAEWGGGCKLSIWSSRRCFSSWHQPGEEVSSELGCQRAAWPWYRALEAHGKGEQNPEEPHCLILTLSPMLQHPWRAQVGMYTASHPKHQLTTFPGRAFDILSVKRGRLESSLLIPCFLNQPSLILGTQESACGLFSTDSACKE